VLDTDGVYRVARACVACGKLDEAGRLAELASQGDGNRRVKREIVCPLAARDQ
jgi:hypothetical protein